jgi:predicted O-methyltransferase YrrM
MIPTQDPAELAAFADLVRRERCGSYLEIGSKLGRSLAAVSAMLDEPAVIVAVDLPKPRGKGDALAALIAELSESHETRLILGDSAAERTIAEVSRLAPFDLVFIDADHAPAAVAADWKNYGPMGRMIAFHDIANPNLGVAALWDEIKRDWRHVEIKLDPRGDHNGIGVLWRQ